MNAFVATCTRGAAAVLAGELGEILGERAFAVAPGAVRWSGALEDGYRACLDSRVASRILLRLLEFPCPDADALLVGVRSIPWPDHLAPGGRVAVDFVGLSAEIRNSKFGAMRTKDGVVDAFVDRGLARPSVDLQRPDVRIHVHLRDEVAGVSIDLSGQALHRRGGRVAGDAPLKETLAAAMLRIAGWPAHARQGKPLVDPMCGSGTLLLEAAGMALDVPAGLSRKHWGFTGWRGHDASTWDALVDEGREQVRAALKRTVAVYGADADPRVLAAARANAQRVGMPLKLAHRRLMDCAPPPGEAGLVVTNPPYGERLSSPAAAARLHRDLGDVLRRRFLGWEAWVITGGPKLAKAIGLRADARHVLHNGPIECRYLQYRISDRAVSGQGPGWR
jgi:23S rRNA (guanine2445-N2)-methyltransferase / 23S rRNA (guanine2069-N7)-methyltransferase